MLSTKKLIIFDGDGTLYLGNNVLPDVRETLSYIKNKGIHCFLYTNNSSKSISDYHLKCKELDLPFDKDTIMTSTEATLYYLKENNINRIYLLATPSVTSIFTESGIQLSETDPECCVLTYDTSITYHKLTVLTNLVRNKLPYIATHPDMVCPSPEGPLPDIGTYIEMINLTTGREPDMILGKPNIKSIRPILARYNFSEEDVVIVGDRLYTDIKMGEGTNVTTVLTLTGETTQDMITRSSIKPNYVIKNLEILKEYIN